MGEKLKKHQLKIITSAVIIVILAFAFWYGGEGSALHGWSASDESATSVTDASVSETELSQSDDSTAVDIASTTEAAPAEEQSQTSTVESPSVSADETATSVNVTSQPVNESGTAAQSNSTVSQSDTGTDQYLTTAPVQAGNPQPVDSQAVTVSDTEHTCTISVSCAALLNNMSLLAEEKQDLVPDDGWILAPVTVTFYEGESVFNVLQRTLKQHGIPMEFVNTPLYNSAYIEGIDNLYEFDAGELSGWTYQVNDWFPNYGCSRYQLQDGDVIEWLYTCDLGKDVGGYNTLGS